MWESRVQSLQVFSGSLNKWLDHGKRVREKKKKVCWHVTDLGTTGEVHYQRFAPYAGS
jgi:hypothetical protein